MTAMMASGPLELGYANLHSTQGNRNAAIAEDDGVDPPRYTRHEHHLHPVYGNTADAFDATPAVGTYGTADIACYQRPRIPRANRRVSFIRDSPEPIAIPVRRFPHIRRRKTRATVFRTRPKLKRGLQVPSRLGTITSGFSLPPILESYGVSRPKWKHFTHELKGHAQLSWRQWVAFFGYSTILNAIAGAFFPIFGMIPAGIIGHRYLRSVQHKNLQAAHLNGAFFSFANHWNTNYFESLGLQVVIAIPGDLSMEDMDVASSKLFRYQQEVGVTAPMPGSTSTGHGRKEARYQIREGHQRVKAALKVRIIFLPFEKPADFVMPTDKKAGFQTPERADTQAYLGGERNGGSSSRVVAGSSALEGLSTGKPLSTRTLTPYYPPNSHA